MAVYEAQVAEPMMPSFQLDELYETSIDWLVSHLGPGRIPWQLTTKTPVFHNTAADPQDAHT